MNNVIGIGTDLVSVARIAKLWARFEINFARRILNPVELTALEKTQHPIAFLAKRYAAKEAFAKAIGTGFRPQGILLTEIAVMNDDLGRPHLEYSGRTAQIVQSKGIAESHISLSDEKEMALAFVLLLGAG